MKIKFEIECGNAAFEDQPEFEVARILRELADRFYLRGLEHNATIRDVNGNKVGVVEVID